MRAILCGLVVLVAVGNVEAASAQSGQSNTLIKSCLDERADKAPDKVIAGCSNLIKNISSIQEWARVLPYIQRGLAYEQKGLLHLAIADYTEIIRRFPAYKHGYRLRSKAFRENGQYECAIRDLSVLLETDKYRDVIKIERSELHAERGSLYLQQYDWNRALADFNDSLAPREGDVHTYSDNIRALYFRAMVHEALGQIDQARVDMERARDGVIGQLVQSTRDKKELDELSDLKRRAKIECGRLAWLKERTGGTGYAPSERVGLKCEAAYGTKGCERGYLIGQVRVESSAFPGLAKVSSDNLVVFVEENRWRIPETGGSIVRRARTFGEGYFIVEGIDLTSSFRVVRVELVSERESADKSCEAVPVNVTRIPVSIGRFAVRSVAESIVLGGLLTLEVGKEGKVTTLWSERGNRWRSVVRDGKISMTREQSASYENSCAPYFELTPARKEADARSLSSRTAVSSHDAAKILGRIAELCQSVKGVLKAEREVFSGISDAEALIDSNADAAITKYRQAISVFPQSVEANGGLVRALAKAGRTAERERGLVDWAAAEFGWMTDGVSSLVRHHAHLKNRKEVEELLRRKGSAAVFQSASEGARGQDLAWAIDLLEHAVLRGWDGSLSVSGERAFSELLRLRGMAAINEHWRSYVREIDADKDLANWARNPIERFR